MPLGLVFRWQRLGRNMTPAAPSVFVHGSAKIGGVPLFGPVQLELIQAGWTCLLGPSGVGKTTILRLIAGLDTGADFTGDIRASDADPLPNRVAYMAQQDLLMPWATVAQNLNFGAKLRGEVLDSARATDMLARVGLADHAHKKPHELSGGQRQRAALARTLMEDKDIILLDEPFSALDARTRTDMQDLAYELLAGRTVLLVTHDPAEAARLGASILVMSETGLNSVPPPTSPAPRAVDDLETLKSQGALMTLLRTTS